MDGDGADFGRGLSILVVEDEPAVRLVLQKVVSAKGFSSSCVDGCVSALQAVEEQPYDLAIVDRNLPDGDGLQIVRRLQKQQHGPEVVVMSADAKLDTAVEAIRLGVADFWVKPFSQLSVLADRLRRVVEHQRVRRENQRLLIELRDRNQKLEAMAVRDSLTGLFNHAFFHDRLESEIGRCARHGRELSLLFIDIDHFKQINDTYGHPVGDAILKEFSFLLRNENRTYEEAFRLAHETIIARYGGDEFIVLLPETSKDGARIKGERLRKAVANCSFGEGFPKVTLSIGTASYPTDAEDREQLIEAADKALYAAKKAGRNKVIAYHADLRGTERPSEQRRKQERESAALEETISKHCFDYAFQPIVCAPEGTIFGYEALCRPAHPAFASPRDLLRAGEQHGKIDRLCRVLREDASRALKDVPGHRVLFINLHPAELEDSELLRLVERLGPELARRAVLEITESRGIADYRHASQTIAALRKQGFRIALDDLGSGYSGLNALSRLHPDFVKLDRTMLIEDPDGRHLRLLRHLLEYTSGEDIQVIAEGIETEAQLDVALGLGVDYMQGFFFAAGASGFAEVDRLPGGTLQSRV